MPVARPEPPDTRVIAHVDLDCFYVQVEQRRHPQLKGKPAAVVQYNPFRGGAIIAVGYEARSSGVTRIMRGDDARKICPDINLVQVPVAHGKADLTIYRDAGSEVVEIFSRMGICERASIDEVYLDITEAAAKRLMQSPPDARDGYDEEVLKTHVVGLVRDSEGANVREWLSRNFASRSDQLLACGAIIVAELRTAVVQETQFTTSAGIAHNKMLAKLASGMHKPAQQTVIPSSEVQALLATLPTKKIKYLGGKLGQSLEKDLGVKNMGDLLPYSESKLQDIYGFNTGTWLWRVARGLNGDEVEGRTLPKSHGCGKTFPGPAALKNLDSVRYWLTELSAELQERLDEDLKLHNRKARLLVVHATCHVVGKATSSMKPFPSKSCVLRYGKERIAADAVQLFKRSLSEFCPDLPQLSPGKGEASGLSCTWAATALSVGANNIYEVPAGMGTITRFFSSPAASNAKEKAKGTAVSSLSPPVSDVSNQIGARSHERFCVYFQDEEVISLNEPDEKILDSADASTYQSNASASLEVEDPVVDFLHEDDEDGECKLPASPNSYSVLSRRERLAWTQERESHSQQQSGKCSPGQLTDRPSPSAESRSENCKSMRRNLMNILDPSACGSKDLVCSPKFGEVGPCVQPLSATQLLDMTSDCHQKDYMVEGTIGTNPLHEPQKRSVGITDRRDEAEVILCSPVEFGAGENLGVRSDIGQEPDSKASTIGMHYSTSDLTKLSFCNVVSSAGGPISETSASLKLSTSFRKHQPVQQGPSCKPMEDITSQVICGEIAVHVLEEDAVHVNSEVTSTSVTTPPQTTAKNCDRLARQEHPIVSPDHASVSACSGPSNRTKIPTFDDTSSPKRISESTKGEGRTSNVSRNGLSQGRVFKRTVFTRVDELWEKWKSASQKSSTSNRSLGNGSIDGVYEQDERNISVLAKPMLRASGVQWDLRLQGQLDRKQPKKKRMSSIGDFFARSPSK